jgi:outer membrane protein assembly factor BamB
MPKTLKVYARPAVAGFRTLWLTPLLLGLGACGVEPGDGARGDWPQFRGPKGLGHSSEPDPPLRWSPGSANIRWKSPIPGIGNSTPTVSGGHVYVTSVIELPPAPGAAAPKDVPPGEEAPKPHGDRAVVALDVATGKELWRTAVFTAPPYKHHFLSSDAAPSTVTDGEYIFAYFGEWLACLDRDGNIVWKKQVDPTYTKELRYGVGSSPVLAGKAVVVARDKEYGEVERDIGWLGAFDRKTGEELWRLQWKDNCCSYATPVVHVREGRTEVIFAHTGKMSGYDAETGKEVWTHEYHMLQPVSSPLADGNVVCYMGGAHNDRGNVCIRITGRAPDAKVEELWLVPRAAPESASPVLFEGALWAVNEAGVLMMYDFENGDLLVQKRLEGQYFRSSIAVAGGHLYVFSTSGMTTVVKPTADKKNFDIVAHNDLGDDGNNASPAFGGGCLLLRSHQHLYCIEKEKPA